MITKEEFLKIYLPAREKLLLDNESNRQANTTILLKALEVELRAAAKTGSPAGGIVKIDGRYPFDPARLTSEVEKWGFRVLVRSKVIQAFLPPDDEI